ncbi:MAG: helix-turn-helix domain-containing protein [Actinomycetes bacterium]
MSASSLLRTARHARGVSQRELARAAHVSQPGIAAVESGAHDTTLDRLDLLLVPLGQRVSLLPTRARPVWQVAVDLRAALEASDEKRAWREIVQCSDDLARETHATRVALAVTQPLPVGDSRYDAVLAAVTDYHLSRDGLPRPVWLDLPEYQLAEPWDVEEVPSLRDRARSDTPPAIARHGVFLAAAELASV